MLLRVYKDETPQKQALWQVFTARAVVFTPRPTPKVYGPGRLKTYFYAYLLLGNQRGSLESDSR